MKIFDVPMKNVEMYAKQIGCRFEGRDVSNGAGCRVEGRLLPPEDGSENPYQRTSQGWQQEGKKVYAVCWHGHRDFYRRIFQFYPDARITSGRYGKIDFRGSENFEETYIETGYIDMGPEITGGYPQMKDACSCPESGEAR